MDPAHEVLPNRIKRLTRARQWDRALAVLACIWILSIISLFIALPEDAEGFRSWVWLIPGTLVFWSLAIPAVGFIFPSLRSMAREREVRLHQAIEAAMADEGLLDSAARPQGELAPGDHPRLDEALDGYRLLTGRSFDIRLERMPVHRPSSRACDACLVMDLDRSPIIRLGSRMLAECSRAELLSVLLHLSGRCRISGAAGTICAGAREADAETLATTRDPESLLSAIRFARSDGDVADGAQAIWFSQEDLRLLGHDGVDVDRVGELERHLRWPSESAARSTEGS